MAFLDNSGDIILDAVLTDTGRYRLAKGDGSFKIVKFAIADDEINYGLYDKNNASGSAYYDLEILQTPVLEAFTNNASSMKSKLISIPRTNLLYLPVMLLADNAPGYYRVTTAINTNNSFVVAVDEDTTKPQDGNGLGPGEGILNGANPALSTNGIRVDQGLDTTEISAQFNLDSDLVETGYIIQIDNRLGTIVAPTNTGTAVEPASVSFIDDDNIASYYLSYGTDNKYVQPLPYPSATDVFNSAVTPIHGPRGTKLMFRIQASIELQTSTFLFEQLGGISPTGGIVPSSTVSTRYIDSIVKVVGQTTGYRIDIPVRFAKV